jgi:hypothetical protein
MEPSSAAQLKTNQNDAFSDFWLATWSVWRSGQLDFFSPSAKRCAEGRFEAFGQDKTLYPGNSLPAIRSCFSSDPHLPGEYLISALLRRKGEPSMLITNLRVWIYDDSDDSLQCLHLKDIARYKFSTGLNSVTARISFKDGTDRKFKSTKFCREDYFCRLLERFNSHQGLPNAPASAQARAEQDQSAGLPSTQEKMKSAAEKERGNFIVFGLIGMALGSLIGAFTLGGSFIGLFAILGGLSGYAIASLVNLINRNQR